jgi:hypothetical protein
MKCELLLNKKVELKKKFVAITLTASLYSFNSFATDKADVAVVREQLKVAADRVTALTKEQTQLSIGVSKLRAALPSQKTDLQTCGFQEAGMLDSECREFLLPILKAKKLDLKKMGQPRFVKIYEILGEDLKKAESCRDTFTQCSYVENHEKLLRNQERLELLKIELDAARREKSELDAELNKTVEACTDCRGAQKSPEEIMAKAMMGTAAINAFSNIAGNLIGMGLGIESMKHYDSNYNAYLKNCMQVGVPCPAPMPMGGFGAPMGGFGAPMGGFGAPMGGFGAPMGGFGAPMGGFGAPMGGFGAPMGGFGVPMGGFGVPMGGFGAPSLAPTVPSLEPTTTGESVAPSMPGGLGGHGVAAMPGGLGGRGVAKMPIGGSKSHAAESLNHQAHLVSNSENSQSDAIVQQDISSDVLDSKESPPKASLKSGFGEIRDGFKTFAGIPYGGLGVSAGFEDSSELPFGGLGVSTSLPTDGDLGNEHSK